MKPSFYQHALYSLLLISQNLCIPLAQAIPSEGVYQVVRGDTLSQIAETQYGNWIKYKDLWKRNEDQVNNPDLILPGQKLRLLSKDEINFFESQNEYASANEAPGALPIHIRKGRSQEWKLLPKQEWEHFIFKPLPELEIAGFDRNGRISKKIIDKIMTPAIIAEDRLAIHGEIINARSEYFRIFLGDIVFVRADEPLQMGNSYSVTTGPSKVTSPLDGRVGFTYDLKGKVKIIGVRDGLFIATVTELRHPIERHQLLIPEVKPLIFPPLTTSSSPITASTLLDGDTTAEMMIEQQVIFLDRGRQDGIKPGMILRHYLKRDPQTQEEITSKDFLIESELMVLDAGKQFSTAIIIRGKGTIKEGDEAISLTDLTDFNRNLGMQSLIQDAGQRSGPDDLDTLDQTDGLGEKEDHELHQLENWNAMEPSTPPQPLTYPDEIKKENVHPGQKNITDLGEEPAPQDGSDHSQEEKKPPVVAPTEIPAPIPSPTPQVESSGPAQSEPAPVK